MEDLSELMSAPTKTPIASSLNPSSAPAASTSPLTGSCGDEESDASRHPNRPRGAIARIREPGPFLARSAVLVDLNHARRARPPCLTYGRFHNPTWTAGKRRWRARRRRGRSPSPRAWPPSTPCSQSARPGDVVVAPTDVLHRQDDRHVVARIARLAGPSSAESRTRRCRPSPARGCWVETPSNPRLEVSDISAIGAAAQAHGAW